MTNSIVWLRRDLRLYDHAALSHALGEGAPVQPIFIFDTEILKRFLNKHDRRLTFIAETLCRIKAELEKRGGTLLVFHGKAQEIVPKLAAEWRAKVFAAEDFEGDTIKRDAEVAKHATLTLVKDHLIFSPKEIVKSDHTPFKVFTPYSKAWLAQLTPSDYAQYPVADNGRYAALSHTQALEFTNAAELLGKIGYQKADLGEWTVHDAQERLKHFIAEKVSSYKDTRDLVGVEGTSKLSPYLRFGLVSVREVLRQISDASLRAERNNPALDRRGAEAPRDDGKNKWLSELIWREFYAMILYHWPQSVASEWNLHYRGLAWSQNTEHFERWKNGQTGFPLVDAAMRQLLQTGWMHNRARMIVASFLTKDLQVDWRLGEEHFAQTLMDYELSSNVGGWQWSASTGTDAQPWFRIFNPYLQSRKFDPAGDYIRKYVPELAHIKGDDIHDPPPLLRGNYPAAMVDHASAREITLAMFKNIDK